ncbi:transglycosylase domain-containing protein [Blattabacterium cuenoti]|uniref:transglycosylase domain-containing protein n=1 Tax=Blattabacterium cuenoti TaxID=1653831 RepID=UPI00163CF0DF|nr:transglycosylase domain-containing protein [Blattabacterium cuenoti]
MNKKNSKQNYYFRLFIIYFWILFFLIISSIFLIIFSASKGYLGDLPSSEEIDNPNIEIGSKIYDSNGKFLGKFCSDNRTLISYRELPKNLINALLAKEDIRFREHSGIDGKSILRAILSFGKKGGGSTISQQLAKLLFTGTSAKNKIERIHQKILEWIMAIELEKRYTKEELITMYCNKFDFLYNAKGISTAALTYFDKKISELNLGECAILIGMLENPSLYNPKSYPDRAKKQRNLVLHQMKKYKFLNKNQYNSESKKPIKIKFNMRKNDSELFTYYKEFLKKEVQDLLDEYKEKTGIKLNISDGLKIYISINSKMQDFAEKSVKKHLKKLQLLFDSMQKNNINAPFSNISIKKTQRILISAMKQTNFYKELKQKGFSEKKIFQKFQEIKPIELFTWNGTKKVKISPWDFLRYKKSIIQAGLISVESSTGYIKAWVGGVDFNHFQYDHVAQTQRQVGSIFKPILYAAAISKFHYTPCTKISNEKFQLGDWYPRNYNGKYGGFITLKDGLAYSINTVSARLISQITPKPVIDLAKKMGVTSFIPEHPSISLGSADITLYEMTGVFNTFANYGNYVKPTILLKVKDKNGNIINKDFFQRRVLNEEISYIMLDLMQGVVKYGTAKRIRQKYNIEGNIAGKTGTTNDNSDGWFIGIIPNLTTGIWVGWENRFSHFDNIKLGQGATMALPIWAYYTKYLYNDVNLIYDYRIIFKKSKNYQFNWKKCEINSDEDNYKFLEQEEFNTKKYENKKEIIENVESSENKKKNIELNEKINRYDEE